MDNSFNGFYKGKKVLVTGHTGFKGAWLSLWLQQLGANVIGFALTPPTKPSLFEVLKLKNRIAHVTGDVRDEHAFRHVVKHYAPDIVFHLAAQSLVRLSYREPKLTYETNVMGTVNLFEAVRGTKGVRVVVNITSDKCYENREWLFGYREIDPLGGYDPYSSSKGCAEFVTTAYRNSFFNQKDYGRTHHVALASVRSGNVIGGGDWAEDRLVPDCIRALAKNRTIILRNPGAVRPWQHVLEPLSGYLWLGALMWGGDIRYSDAWNFGPGDEDIFTVEDAVKKIIELWGKGRCRIRHNAKFHEARLLKLDISKAYFKLGWRPVYHIHEALEKAIIWYKQYYSHHSDMYDYTVRQISEYTCNADKIGLRWSRSARGALLR
jgi:CDP-glucose 4,6-dehydratase